MVIGTHTSDGEQNHLQIAEVQLPNDYLGGANEKEMIDKNPDGGHDSASEMNRNSL